MEDSLELKAFYVRGATHKDIGMCCCKTLLHAPAGV